MKNRWSDLAAREALQRWSSADADLALRVYTARLIGEEAQLVLHGGGNCSVKGVHRNLFGETVEAVFVKASGWDLREIEPAGFPGLDLAYLRRLRALPALDDERMVNELRTHLFDAAAPTPSIETLLHAFLPYKFVDHSHANALLALTNQPDGEALIRRALGDRVILVPYVYPGFELAKVVADACEARPDADGVVLLHHGLLTFGEEAKRSYEKHIALVDACERFLAAHRRRSIPTPRYVRPHRPEELAARWAPLLRGLLAEPTGDDDQPYRRSILEWRGGRDLLALIHGAEAERLASAGPLTGDHLIHTKRRPLFVANPRWDDEAALREQMASAIESFRRDHESYRLAHGGSADGADSSPRVVLLPGAGLFAWGATKKLARIVADIAEQTLFTHADAEAVGSYVPLADDHLHAMEHRGLQRVKLPADRDRPLERQVVVISGGAGAIGVAVAEACLAAGAHAAIADRDETRLARAADGLAARHGRERILPVLMDVTDESSVREGFDRVVLAFGGVDVVVPNAGVAHVAPIEALTLSDFQQVMNVNTAGCLLFLREGVRRMKEQGLGGNVVINASKNVFAPGKDFGAYSASKAAAHQLGKVAAIELASHRIRVNMINADAVFGDEANPSHLWEVVGPERAKSRGLAPQDLPEYYRRRNLLQTRVLARHVGAAVVFFASNQSPTTGATLPVDGGLPEAFPR